MGIYKNFIKRLLDIILTLFVIIVLSPLLLILALYVRLHIGSPIIFKQERPGKNEKIFLLYKFRTMTNEKDSEGNLLPDKVRITKFGRILRSTSLDELPELFNILKGDMSLVGPRPLLVRYLPYYTDQEKHRHDIRPGLTGLAQINGRSFITWEKIFEYDLKYVSKVSFCFDLKILCKTITKVFRKTDIADVSQFTERPDGKLYSNKDDTILHQPLDKERADNANRNR